jgi:hypothetical protein
LLNVIKKKRGERMSVRQGEFLHAHKSTIKFWKRHDQSNDYGGIMFAGFQQSVSEWRIG